MPDDHDPPAPVPAPAAIPEAAPAPWTQPSAVAIPTPPVNAPAELPAVPTSAPVVETTALPPAPASAPPAAVGGAAPAPWTQPATAPSTSVSAPVETAAVPISAPVVETTAPPAAVSSTHTTTPLASVTPRPAASMSPAYPVIPATAAAYGPPPVTHLKQAPRPLSTLPQQLRRLAYVVSLVVGGSAILAGAWSIFLLPLLHATYSARNAIAGAQKDRWRTMLDKLQSIRSLGIFPLALTAEENAERDAVIAKIETEKAEKAAAKEQEKDKQVALRELPDAPGSPKSAAGSISDELPPATKPPPLPLRADVGDLSAALKDLAANLDATATTRTSLVSTLEGYTSGLHREMYLARSGGPSTPWGPVPGATSSGRVGLGTLSANLASAGGKVAGQPEASPLGIPPARSEEWDNVRREVRAIKGLLLNRRNFSVPARAA